VQAGGNTFRALNDSDHVAITFTYLIVGTKINIRSIKSLSERAHMQLEKTTISTENTGYSALPSPPRIMRHAAAARRAETIRSAADTHTDTQTLSDTVPSPA